VLQMGCGSILG